MSGSTSGEWDGLVVIAAGVSWDDAWMSEKHLAIALSRHAPVLFVDPPVSWLTPLRKPQLRATLREPRLRVLRPGLARLTPLAPPGVTRPVLRELAYAATRSAIRHAVRRLDARVTATIVASLDPVLGSAGTGLKVVYGTDDWVSGGTLMGIGSSWLERREREQLASADLVVAVSPTLAERWVPMTTKVAVIPNGCDVDAFAETDQVAAAPDVPLAGPIAGFIGHMSARIDLDMVEAVADTGSSVLLVGPRQLTFDPTRLDRLLERENVHWTGPRPFDLLSSYMRHITVGLTPYTDTAFNRSSYPLKTLEYLAAGRPAVVSDLPAAHLIPDEMVVRCRTPEEFARATVELLGREPDATAVARRKEYARTQSWAARADDVADALGIPRRQDSPE